MRAHGGDIRLERSDSNGTLFRLVLPLRQADRQPTAKAS
jgi:signal transduction histidine kinase